MHQHHNEGREYLLVEVPNGEVKYPYINGYGDRLCYRFNGFPTCDVIPEGKREIIGLASDLSEDQAAQIVDGYTGCYNDYILFRGHLRNYVETALESLESLVRSIGLELSTTLILVKQ